MTSLAAFFRLNSSQSVSVAFLRLYDVTHLVRTGRSSRYLD